jgi:putative ABC transport system permease protein
MRPQSAFAIGRLKQGVSLKAARDELNAIVGQLPPDDPGKPSKSAKGRVSRAATEGGSPQTNSGAGRPVLRDILRNGVNVVRLDEEVASGIRPALLILFAVAGCVLLIACANIANLRLAGTAARERELALRTAMGATRARLVRQLLTESIALALAGAAVGLLLSVWAVKAIVNLYPERIPRLESLSPEPAVFAFLAGLALLTAVLFGAVPAWRYSRPDVEEILKGASGAGGRRDAARFRDVLTATQIASALVLLIGAGLLLRSFLLMRAIDPGYRRHNLLVAHFMLDNKAYASPGDQASFVRRIMDRIAAMPSVEMAGATNSLPLDFNFLMSVTFGIEGRPELGTDVFADCRAVTPYFLQTMGIRLSAGRYLGPADSVVSGGVLVNRAFAAQYFGRGNPVGRHLRFGDEMRTIVGVVTDIKDIKLDRKTIAALYIPFDRQPTPFVDLAIRTAADPRFLVNAIRTELRAVDPNQPMGKVTTMDDVLIRAVAKPRWYAILVGTFAGLALLIAAVGIYGVVAFSVGRRTYEIGIRMALGAQKNDVLRMVVLRGSMPSLAGAIVGLAIALPASKVLTSILYGVQPLDFRTYCVVALTVPMVAFGAAYIPARRALRIDPMAALRQD